MQQLFGTLIFAALIASISAGIQSTAVTGILICGKSPYPFATVELWDKDTLDPDDLMANGTSEHDGGFFLQGNQSELTTIDPELRIFHKCGDPTAKCYKQIIIEIPDDFVTADEKPQKIYQVHTIDLKVVTSTESKICEE
uniref:Uncharacterized protein n=1 Tax=Panagrolaimus sp. ES5 TaxID=591445 RepID=A0AC34FMI1_9BILA